MEDRWKFGDLEHSRAPQVGISGEADVQVGRQRRPFGSLPKTARKDVVDDKNDVHLISGTR